MKGVAEGLGAQALAADLGMSLGLSVHADSSAAIGICRRSGVGRVRHLAVGQLWVQDHLRRGTFQLFKVRGDENPADLCTKHLARAVIDGLIQICGIVRETGRAVSAPRLNVEIELLPTKPLSVSSRHLPCCLWCIAVSLHLCHLQILAHLHPPQDHHVYHHGHLRIPTYLHLRRHRLHETTTNY